jgi:hypothetical protein
LPLPGHWCTNFYSGLKKSTDNAIFVNKIEEYIIHTAAELLLCEWIKVNGIYIVDVI